MVELQQELQPFALVELQQELQQQARAAVDKQVVDLHVVVEVQVELEVELGMVTSKASSTCDTTRASHGSRYCEAQLPQFQLTWVETSFLSVHLQTCPHS